MFKYPSDWNDDERMAFLFRGLKPRDINPLGYDEKLDFWKRLICDYTSRRKQAIFSLQSLMDDFTRKNQQPVCLWPVLETLKKEGLIRTCKTLTWTEWITSWFSSQTSEQDALFVNAEVFDTVLKEVRDAIWRKSYREAKVSYNEVWDTCRSVCDDNEKLFKLVLGAIPGLTVQGESITFSPNSDLIQPLTEHDKALISINEAIQKISDKLESLNEQHEELKSVALKHKQKGDEKMALAVLRRRRRVVERITRNYDVLDRLHQMQTDLENQKDMAKILEGFKLATFALKSANNELDKVHNIVDDLQDAAAEHHYIEESISTPIVPDTQLSDLEAELQQILEESEPIHNLPTVPSEELNSRDTNSIPSVAESEPKHKKRIPWGYYD